MVQPRFAQNCLKHPSTNRLRLSDWTKAKEIYRLIFLTNTVYFLIFCSVDYMHLQLYPNISYASLSQSTISRKIKVLKAGWPPILWLNAIKYKKRQKFAARSVPDSVTQDSAYDCVIRIRYYVTYEEHTTNHSYIIKNVPKKYPYYLITKVKKTMEKWHFHYLWEAT